MKLVVIGPEELRLGFASAGAEFVSADTHQEALEMVQQFASSQEIGMLLITSVFARFFRPELDRLRATHPLPLILEIPDFEARPLEKSELLLSVAATFGIKV